MCVLLQMIFISRKALWGPSIVSSKIIIRNLDIDEDPIVGRET